MARSVSVNGRADGAGDPASPLAEDEEGHGLDRVDMPFDVRGPEFGVDGGIDDRGMAAIGAPSPAAASDQGPCLYLGPAGQRCDRRAVKGGFCSQHQPGAALRKIAKPSKLLAAIAGIVGVLWPYVYDFVHELIRWIHPR